LTLRWYVAVCAAWCACKKQNTTSV
jgi:hypothetical protein